jgi:hypothetical protein
MSLFYFRQRGGRRAHAGDVEEVGEERVAVLGGDAFGMKLHAVHGMRLVLQAHDDGLAGLGGLGGDGQTIGQAGALDDQRMIARDLECPGQALEHALGLVGDLGELAVHEDRRADDFAAVGLADRLMA